MGGKDDGWKRFSSKAGWVDGQAVDIECLCTFVVLMDAFFSDYFSSFLSWFIT